MCDAGVRMNDMTVVLEGIAFGESPRWHDGRVWFSDWGAGQIVTVSSEGVPEVVVRVESFPLCFDFLPDGRLLAVDSARQRLLRRESDGSLSVHAELGAFSTKPWNDIVVDAVGNAYVNTIGYDFPQGEPAPGSVVRVAVDGGVEPVADGLAFPNGMAITADGAALIVAESYANRLTAFDIGEDGRLGPAAGSGPDAGDDHPDGICIDTEGAVWYADVSHRHCVRIREGGEILDVVELDRGAFACILDRDAEQPQLYVVGQEYGTAENSGPTGQLVKFPAPAPGAGRP